MQENSISFFSFQADILSPAAKASMGAVSLHQMITGKI
jgi:hypothetical protein